MSKCRKMGRTERLLLYNDWRPKTFKEVIGQPAAVVLNNLANQKRKSKVHSILLTGTRGVGKTTLARLFARGMNCTSKVQRPCLECESCKRANHPDIREIDSAVFGSAEGVASLVEKMGLLPTYTYKIYIFDEAHMLSKKAMAILLKTVEEPGTRVFVLLLTTDPDKLDQALRSRCMWLQLKPIEKIKLMKLVATVCVAEEIKISKEAIALIADYAQGSAREALSLLEAVRHVPEVTQGLLSTLVGHKVETHDLINLLLAKDYAAAFVEANRLCDFNDAKQVLKSLAGQVAEIISKKAMEGQPVSNILPLLEMCQKAKRDSPYEQQPQLLLEVLIAEYMYLRNDIPAKAILISDWPAFVAWLEKKNRRLSERAKKLKFVRMKQDTIAVLKTVKGYPFDVKAIETVAKVYTKQRDLTLEVV